MRGREGKRAALPRARGAQVAKRFAAPPRGRSAPPTRGRRGLAGYVPAVWRRTRWGENRITCLGVWKSGTRRMSRPRNRTGATDWHRLGRDCAATGARRCPATA